MGGARVGAPRAAGGDRLQFHERGNSLVHLPFARSIDVGHRAVCLPSGPQRAGDGEIADSHVWILHKKWSERGKEKSVGREVEGWR
eukprot:6847107-Pyramimonas_sp.AAC.1